MALWLAETVAVILWLGAATEWAICFAGTRADQARAFEYELQSW